MSSKESEFYVVGIGASAGGLDAIQQLFDHIPNDTGMAFVIIQHLSPDFVSLMPELLGKHTDMPIHTAEDKLTIEPNAIYLNQRNKNLHIKGRQLFLLDKGPKHNLNLPIDIFFHTLGEEYKDKSIGVILSGTGSDGSRGIKTIKEGGGVVIVQDPISTQFDGMPKSAIATNHVDYILDTSEMAKIFENIPLNGLNFTTRLDLSKPNDDLFERVLQEVYRYSGIDFREYKVNTLQRRLEKRMNVNNIDQLYDYLTYLKSNPNEKEAIKRDFLIGVTQFFRDTEAFEVMRAHVIPTICNSKQNTDTIRIWCAGCSTGEEVYSIAILFDEYIRAQKLQMDFKIFATDVDDMAIGKAGTGSYFINAINEIENRYLESYFLKTGDKIQIIKRIREKVVFSVHNILQDPPFIKIDLITCRNLLIYLSAGIQKRILSNFRFALNKHGYLFLGNSESMGDISASFKTIDAKWKIFENIADVKIAPERLSVKNKSQKHLQHSTRVHLSTPDRPSKDSPELVFHKYLSRRYSPATIFVNSKFDILFMVGDAGHRLNHHDGFFENNLLKTVNPEVASAIRNGVRKLNEHKADIIIRDITTKKDGQPISFDITIHKPTDAKGLADCYLIQFSTEKTVERNAVEIKNISLDEVANMRVADLENELDQTRLELQKMVEEVETSNEELQSTNEELMASNEEMQSTNEELQSVNEELHMVNSELEEKNKELQHLNNDFSNLLNSTEIGTLFLDTQLRIRKFTPALQEYFNLTEADRGREIASFASNFNDEIRADMMHDINTVLKKPSTIEKEVSTHDGKSFLLRISPFLTDKRVIDGVVISFVDLTALNELRGELQKVESSYRALFENLNEGFLHGRLLTNAQGAPVDWECLAVNPAFERQTGLRKMTGKKMLSAVARLKKDDVDWLTLLSHTALTGKKQSVEKYSSTFSKHFIIQVFSPKHGEFAATFTDVTAIKEAEKDLRKSEKLLKVSQSIAKVGGWELDLTSNKLYWTSETYHIHDTAPDEYTPTVDTAISYFLPESQRTITAALKAAIDQGKGYDLELETYTTKKRHIHVRTTCEVTRIDGRPVKLTGIFQDITAQKQIEKELVSAKEKAEGANELKNLFLANMSHEIRTPMNGVMGFAELLKSPTLSQEERRHYAEIIDSNSKQLLRLIDDVLDISKIEANELNVTKVNCVLGDLLLNLQTTFDKLKTMAGKEHIQIAVQIPEQYKDLVIVTDEYRLQQVLTNLLNNALKFTDEGEITFGFEVQGTQLQLFVKDQGIGIPEDQLTAVFHRFKQAEPDMSAKYGGAGLGLSISKGIVDRLGGTIEVQSELGAGTVFFIRLPLEKAENREVTTNKDQKHHISLDGKTILVADDGPTARFYFKQVLKGHQVNLLFAVNGKEAVALYRAHPEIDLVLMDIRMPEMNGFEASEEIIKMNPEAKIIIQSAFAMADEKENSLRAGCCDYLTKPIQKHELYRLLDKWL